MTNDPKAANVTWNGVSFHGVMEVIVDEIVVDRIPVATCVGADHILDGLDAEACRCGAVLVTERGIVLAANPDEILQPMAAPRTNR